MMFENLNRVAMNELKKLDMAYANKEEFSPEDAKKYECLMHGWKCQLTSEAMHEAESQAYGNETNGMSGMRGRNPMNGRYVSRGPQQPHMGNDMSYADGYSEGYREGMQQSGHFPTMPERYRY